MIDPLEQPCSEVLSEAERIYLIALVANRGGLLGVADQELADERASQVKE